MHYYKILTSHNSKSCMNVKTYNYLKKVHIFHIPLESIATNCKGIFIKFQLKLFNLTFNFFFPARNLVLQL